MALSLVQDQNIADRVADELRAAIDSGRLAPGARLVERQLSTELGVSHIPIREALARLADEGLVERRPRRGSRVRALTAADFDEISGLRVVLERYVVVRVQERLTERSEAELRKLVDSMIQAAERGDGMRLFELDRRFHEKLWALAEHQMLTGLVAQLRGRINGFLRAANAALESDALLAHARSHADLVDAIASGDPETAKAAMEEHIRIAAERVNRALPAD
ncbi:MAG TPA: GntR family transcriptional regulator [Conexibacter sp.]|nr:GntR family transcriptional regulator [Conexibacter sp.]